MVVVAVVAILSATAIPTYQNYLIRSKMGTARSYVDSFNRLVTNYYSDHGSFPNDSALGISSSVPASASQYLHPPYLAYVTIAPQTTTASQCPYSIHTAYFSNYSGDYYANSTSKYVVLNNYFIDNHGTMVIKCSAYEFDPETSSITINNYFADCELTDDPQDIMNFINTSCA
jgi:Tfp pilus assembly protein PilE